MFLWTAGYDVMWQVRYFAIPTPQVKLVKRSAGGREFYTRFDDWIQENRSHRLKNGWGGKCITQVSVRESCLLE